MHLFAVGKTDVLTSENSMHGCILKPNMGSSVVPVPNCNTFSNVIGFLLPPFKKCSIYNEVVAKKRGRRTAAINLSIQVALNHIAISTTGLQKLFLGSNIPAPSTSSMQHSANVV